MNRKKKNLTNILIAAALIACGGLLCGKPALAQPVPGCDQRVLDTMETKANAVVAYKVAATEQMKYKNDSVVFMTCFNSAAGNAAKNLGDIFSGDYTAGLVPIIDDALPSFADDYKMALGNDLGYVDYSAAAQSMNTNMTSCTGTQDLWEQHLDDPLPPDLPYPEYFDNFVQGNVPQGGLGAPPAATTTFTKDWTTSNTANGTEDNDFANLKTNINALPQTDMAQQANTASGGTPGPSTAAINRTCELMYNYGLTTSATCP